MKSAISKCNVLLYSLGVEPLYPQICVRESTISKWTGINPTPMELGALLNSIPCSLAFARDDHFQVIDLVALVSHSTS